MISSLLKSLEGPLSKVQKLSKFVDFFTLSTKRNASGSTNKDYLSQMSSNLAKLYNLAQPHLTKQDEFASMFLKKLPESIQELFDNKGAKKRTRETIRNIMRVMMLGNNDLRRDLLTLFRDSGYTHKELQDEFDVVSKPYLESNIAVRGFPCARIFQEEMSSPVMFGDHHQKNRESFVVSTETLLLMIDNFFQEHSHTSPMTNKKFQHLFVLHFESASEMYRSFCEFVASGKILQSMNTDILDKEDVKILQQFILINKLLPEKSKIRVEYSNIVESLDLTIIQGMEEQWKEKLLKGFIICEGSFRNIWKNNFTCYKLMENRTDVCPICEKGKHLKKEIEALEGDRQQEDLLNFLQQEFEISRAHFQECHHSKPVLQKLLDNPEEGSITVWADFLMKFKDWSFPDQIGPEFYEQILYTCLGFHICKMEKGKLVVKKVVYFSLRHPQDAEMVVATLSKLFSEPWFRQFAGDRKVLNFVSDGASHFNNKYLKGLFSDLVMQANGVQGEYVKGLTIGQALFNNIHQLITVPYHGKGPVDRMSAILKEVAKEMKKNRVITADMKGFITKLRDMLLRKHIMRKDGNPERAQIELLTVDKEDFSPFLSCNSSIEAIEKRLREQQALQSAWQTEEKKKEERLITRNKVSKNTKSQTSGKKSACATKSSKQIDGLRRSTRISQPSQEKKDSATSSQLLEEHLVEEVGEDKLMEDDLIFLDEDEGDFTYGKELEDVNGENLAEIYLMTSDFPETCSTPSVLNQKSKSKSSSNSNIDQFVMTCLNLPPNYPKYFMRTDFCFEDDRLQIYGNGYYAKEVESRKLPFKLLLEMKETRVWESLSNPKQNKVVEFSKSLKKITQVKKMMGEDNRAPTEKIVSEVRLPSSTTPPNMLFRDTTSSSQSVYLTNAQQEEINNKQRPTAIKKQTKQQLKNKMAEKKKQDVMRVKLSLQSPITPLHAPVPPFTPSLTPTNQERKRKSPLIETPKSKPPNFRVVPPVAQLCENSMDLSDDVPTTSSHFLPPATPLSFCAETSHSRLMTSMNGNFEGDTYLDGYNISACVDELFQQNPSSAFISSDIQYTDSHEQKYLKSLIQNTLVNQIIGVYYLNFHFTVFVWDKKEQRLYILDPLFDEAQNSHRVNAITLYFKKATELEEISMTYFFGYFLIQYLLNNFKTIILGTQKEDPPVHCGVYAIHYIKSWVEETPIPSRHRGVFVRGKRVSDLIPEPDPVLLRLVYKEIFLKVCNKRHN